MQQYLKPLCQTLGCVRTKLQDKGESVPVKSLQAGHLGCQKCVPLRAVLSLDPPYRADFLKNIPNWFPRYCPSCSENPLYRLSHLCNFTVSQKGQVWQKIGGCWTLEFSLTLKSKWRPYKREASSVLFDSIFRAILSPLRAMSTGLWFSSMLAILPSEKPPLEGMQSGVPTCSKHFHFEVCIRFPCSEHCGNYIVSCGHCGDYLASTMYCSLTRF